MDFSRFIWKFYKTATYMCRNIPYERFYFCSEF